MNILGRNEVFDMIDKYDEILKHYYQGVEISKMDV